MAITNPFTITYGSRSVGGSSSTYLLHGPYQLDRSFETIRCVFDVVVVSASYSGLQSASETLETDFRRRDQNLVISISGNNFTFTSGSTILNTMAEISKTGDAETDRGYSRSYTCVVHGELPADDASTGLRDIEWNVNLEPGRQKIVTTRGVYTATSSRTASANYLHAQGADAEASTFLIALDNAATFELVDEQYTEDRNNHTCSFSRQYVELLENQTQNDVDDTEIRDHRVTFTDLSQFPGDSAEKIDRLRRVVGTYDCSIDMDEVATTDKIRDITKDKILPHIKARFEELFEPDVFALEDARETYDETAKRISLSFQILYQTSDNTDIVEVSQSLTYRENRTIDYTPLHDDDELAANVDAGWATRERIWSRTVIVKGDDFPKFRIGDNPEAGPAGLIEQVIAGKTDKLDSGARSGVRESGWNIISNTSQATDQWIGLTNRGISGEFDQIKLTVLTESVVERFSKSPKSNAPNTFASISGGRTPTFSGRGPAN